MLTETVITGLNDVAGAAFYIFMACSVCYTVGSIVKSYLTRNR